MVKRDNTALPRAHTLTHDKQLALRGDPVPLFEIRKHLGEEKVKPASNEENRWQITSLPPA